jgi:phosphomannomutase/phosphoglucomutase
MEIRFGTSGVRGLTDVDITEEICWKVGTAIAGYFGNGATLALGYDTRPGAQRLAGVCAAAMKNAGAIILNLGVAPSPLVCAAIHGKKLAGGLMVTGSHLSYDRIGLIPLDGAGAIPPRAETARIAEMAKSVTPPEKIKGQLPDEQDFTFEYLEFIKQVCGSQLPGKGITLALDTAGATGAGLIPRLMNDLGCEVKPMHDSRLDFAPRKMEPRADCVSELSDLVRDTGANFGAAYDSDCDRVLFVDEAGKPISEDLAAAIFARYIYSGGPGTVVTPVNSSGMMKKVWKGTVVECIIGPPEISLAAKQNNAVFAYEESGKYFFPPEVMWADGIIATAMMARVISASRKKLSDIVREFPVHVQIKRNVKGAAGNMQDVLARVKGNFNPQGAILNDIDGLKYQFGDGSWLLIRASGTEPLVRVYVDSPSPSRARELSEMGIDIVKKNMEGIA